MEILLKALVRKGIFRTLEVQKIMDDMNDAEAKTNTKA